jgi:hypothetical protein
MFATYDVRETLPRMPEAVEEKSLASRLKVNKTASRYIANTLDKQCTE